MSAGLCPKCLRRYPDGAAAFCKADGTPLVPVDEARGAGSTWDRLPMARPGEVDRGPIFDRAEPTAHGPLSTIRGVVPPGLATAPPPTAGKGRELLRILLLLLLAAALAAAIFRGLG